MKKKQILLRKRNLGDSMVSLSCDFDNREMNGREFFHKAFSENEINAKMQEIIDAFPESEVKIVEK